jgi:hypothetical protein
MAAGGKLTMKESDVQRFDAEVTEKKADDAPKVKRTRSDFERVEEHTGIEGMKSMLIRG